MAEGLSESTVRNAEQNGYGREKCMRAALAVQPESDAAATIAELERSVRLEIRRRIKKGASDGLLVGTLKITTEVLAGQPEPVGVSREDEDLAQQLVYVAARVAVERVWSRTRPEPVPELDDEDLRAIRVEALYAKIAAEELAAKAVIPANGDDAVDAELIEPTEEQP